VQHCPEFVIKDNKEVVDGYTEFPSIFNDEPGKRNGPYWHEIEPDTLGQYIGNYGDQKVYEGDIVLGYNFKVESFCEGEVVWDSLNACFALSIQNPHVGIILDPLLLYDTTRLFVQGNIYDNPELINKKS